MKILTALAAAFLLAACGQEQAPTHAANDAVESHVAGNHDTQDPAQDIQTEVDLIESFDLEALPGAQTDLH